MHDVSKFHQVPCLVQESLHMNFTCYLHKELESPCSCTLVTFVMHSIQITNNVYVYKGKGDKCEKEINIPSKFGLNPYSIVVEVARALEFKSF